MSGFLPPTLFRTFEGEEAMQLVNEERPACLVPPKDGVKMGFFSWTSEEGHMFTAMVTFDETLVEEVRATRLDASAPEKVKEVMARAARQYSEMLETLAMGHDVVSAIEGIVDGECGCSVCQAKKHGRGAGQSGDDIGLFN
jgi:hypothetical protein